LTTLFVLPQFRGLGIAKQLIHRGIQLAKRLGYSTLYLWTEDKQNMYSHLGWKVLHDAEYAGSKITIMSYDLTSESDSVSARTQTTNQ
jgi:GNAT superfamily N-acetyltransferase